MVMYEACDGFNFIFWKHRKLSQKNDFLTHFERFLVYAFLRPMNYAPIFEEMKGLMKIHNPGKFHLYNVSGCQVINFQKIPYEQKVQILAASGWFFKDYSPK